MSTVACAHSAAITVALGTLGGAPALATNGRHAAGYGIKAEGMAGAEIASPLGSPAISTNPAGLAATSNWDCAIAIDWRQIGYPKIPPVGNSAANPNRQPIPGVESFFDIPVPIVAEAHDTSGLSWRPNAANEANMSLLHEPRRKVDGPGAIPAAFGGREANIGFEQTSIGAGWSRRL